MPKIEPIYDERPWGHFHQFCKNAPVTVKIINVKPNESLSLQSHAKREEFWKVISGSGVAEIGDEKKDINVGEEIVVPVGAKHRLSAGEGGIEILEIAQGEFDENDIIRYEDKYGRAN